jgi:transposase
MMLSLSTRVRIFAATEPIEFRKGFDGLVQIVRDTFGEDPFAGDLFCFFNSRRDRVKVLEERLNEAMAQLAKADAQAAGEILGQFSAQDRLHPGWTQVDADLQLARRSMEESKQGMQAAIQARDTAGVRSAAAAFLRAQASGEEARRIGASRDEYEAGLAAAIGEAWNSCKQALDGNQVQQFDDRFAQLQSMLAGAPIGNYVKNAKLEELIEYRQSRGKSNKLEDLVARLESALVSPSAGGILIDGLLAELEKLAPADARLDGLRRRAKARADELCAKRVESWAEVLDLAPKPGIVKDEAARAAIVAAQLPWRVRHKRTGIVMLLVPAMRGLEKPFYLAQAELTWGQWYEKLGAVAPYEPSDAKPWDWSIDDIKMRFKAKSDADDYRFGAKWKLDPVWRADPAESARVLKRMDLRLPTHEEWLVAAFGSTGQAPQNLPQIARYKNTSAQIGLDDARRHMPEAKELPLNVMGFTNILGNVWELLADGRFIGGASNSTQSEVLDGAARRLDGGWRGIRPAYTPD